MVRSVWLHYEPESVRCSGGFALPYAVEETCLLLPNPGGPIRTLCDCRGSTVAGHVLGKLVEVGFLNGLILSDVLDAD